MVCNPETARGWCAVLLPTNLKPDRDIRNLNGGCRLHFGGRHRFHPEKYRGARIPGKQFLLHSAGWNPVQWQAEDRAHNLHRSYGSRLDEEESFWL